MLLQIHLRCCRKMLILLHRHTGHHRCRRCRRRTLHIRYGAINRRRLRLQLPWLNRCRDRLLHLIYRHWLRLLRLLRRYDLILRL